MPREIDQQHEWSSHELAGVGSIMFSQGILAHCRTGANLCTRRPRFSAT